jgi:chemotaxis protein methyltransferase CheR
MTEAGPPASGAQVENVDLEIDLLIEAIYRKYSYDFRNYARASLRRRVLGALPRFGVESVSMLQHVILHNPDRFSSLLAQLTVPVSELFRDPAYFKSLRERVLPVLTTYPSLKVWVAGCGTGEEVYSLAILLDELQLLERTIVYATDINPESLRAAEAGVFAMDRVPGFTRNYQRAGGRRSLADYYTAAYAGVVFDRRLRRRITFSDHSLATDQVFAEVHFVSCRNVLIYFNPQLQDRAIGLFREALVTLGFLGLGSHERIDVSTHHSGFEAVDRQQRLYRKTG